jgi:hypothetical protein
MRLERLGANFQCRLSFIRILMRRMQRENWRFDRPVFNLNADGIGVAVYRVQTPERMYSLVAFSHDLPADQRSDRVIAEAWDATFALVDGEATDADIQRLSENVPKQEAGRVSRRELTLSRANRSVRLFDHVVERLAVDLQPDPQMIENTGYLMRTTAVYGSGKFGAEDHAAIAGRPEFGAPFQAEMLTVYLIRAFSIDLVEHLAKRRNANAAKIAPAMRRRLGIGNSTGLGMAPFVLNHPMLINNWISARETALARVRALPSAAPDAVKRFSDLVDRAAENAKAWNSDHPLQQEKLALLRADLKRLTAHISEGAPMQQQAPWNALYEWAEARLSIEGQEQLVSLLIDTHGALSDDLPAIMSANEADTRPIDGGMSIGALKAILEETYAFALSIDWSQNASVDRVWYVSTEKLEPRLGKRFDEDIEPYEEPLSPARDAARLHLDLANWPADETVAAFLLQNPQHRHMVRRVQLANRLPYAEIRDNTVSAKVLPIDILRAKLAFFGAARFDPRSDRWVRINMFQGAPFFDELHQAEADDWMYPAMQAIQ